MIVLHGFPMSPNTRRALVALEECGVPYEFSQVDLMSGQQRGEAYKSLNPTARVPTLVEGDLVLWESNAILVYLAERFPDRLFGGKTAAERGEVARWMFMNAAHLSPAVARIFAHTIRLPEEQRNPKIVEESRAEVSRCLAPLDGHLAGRDFIAPAYGIADLSIAPALAVAPMLGIDLQGWPNLGAWLARVKSRPAWKKIYE
ncbi:MAG TPA: glutathione S-transferase family protein [Labilithrix sp.]|nr:glutathione S-transferase family protein [Labilithrix sp.]